MTTWITGANGFIGRHLVRVLADQGHAVHGIGHGAINEAERRSIGLGDWLSGEIDAANLNTLAGQSGLPSTVFHLAGGSSVGLSIAQPLEDFSRTVASTAQLLEWIRSSAPTCRLIVASSAAVYGAHHDGPIGEDDELIPMSPYGQHKLMMEQLCRSYAVTFGVQSTVARLFSVYGLNLRKQLLWDLCSRLQRGERPLVVAGSGAEIRDWIDVRDAARLFAVIAGRPQREAFEVFNGGSGLGTSVADVAGMLAKQWGGGVAVRFSKVVRPGDPFSLLADDKKLRESGFACRIPVSEGLAQYVTWFKDQAR